MSYEIERLHIETRIEDLARQEQLPFVENEIYKLERQLEEMEYQRLRSFVQGLIESVDEIRIVDDGSGIFAAEGTFRGRNFYLCPPTLTVFGVDDHVTEHVTSPQEALSFLKKHIPDTDKVNWIKEGL